METEKESKYFLKCVSEQRRRMQIIFYFHPEKREKAQNARLYNCLQGSRPSRQIGFISVFELFVPA